MTAGAKFALQTQTKLKPSSNQAIELINTNLFSFAILPDKKEIQFITRGQLLFYLFAPTLVYRDEYPRLPKRDYKLLAKLIVQWGLVLYFMMIITLRIFLPTFSKVGKGPISTREFVLDLTIVFAASSAFCLLVFYGFLHLYQNIWSQVSFWVC